MVCSLFSGKTLKRAPGIRCQSNMSINFYIRPKRPSGQKRVQIYKPFSISRKTFAMFFYQNFWGIEFQSFNYNKTRLEPQLFEVAIYKDTSKIRKNQQLLKKEIPDQSNPYYKIAIGVIWSWEIVVTCKWGIKMLSFKVDSGLSNFRINKKIQSWESP